MASNWYIMKIYFKTDLVILIWCHKCYYFFPIRFVKFIKVWLWTKLDVHLFTDRGSVTYFSHRYPIIKARLFPVVSLCKTPWLHMSFFTQSDSNGQIDLSLLSKWIWWKLMIVLSGTIYLAVCRNSVLINHG